jgi:carboxyl-terminal processing protease
MKINKKSVALGVGFICLLAVATQLVYTADAEKPKNSVETYRLLNLFGDVFERVRKDYVETPTDEELIEAAIAGMLTSLDPHSSYMNSKSYKEMKVNTRGEFGGLGIQVTMDKGFVKVISPIDDTPAYRAGIEAGDYITHLDAVPVLGMTLQDAVEKMRGKVGANIKLTVRRKGTADPFVVTVTRAVIKITSVRSRLEGKIGYVRITSFTEQSDKGLKKAVDEFEKELGNDLIGIVLDLRNNPGGLLDQAVTVSDAFLERGEIVSTRSRNTEDTSRFSARPGDLAKGKPLVVLINGGSASASEIVAGALQDHKRAVILGTQSFGKGSVQTIMSLPGHGAMRLTTARYYTPSGRSIQGEGVTPDIIVEPSKIEAISKAAGRRESDLKGALENDNAKNKAEEINNKANTLLKDNEKVEEPVDYQLMRALDLIRGVHLFTVEKESKEN